MLELEQAAQGFAAIGSEPRLEVLLALVRAGHRGLSVGALQERLDIPASTLAHHLRFLEAADVIRRMRDGRTVNVIAQYDVIEALAGYLRRECCADEQRPDDRPAAAGEGSA